MKNVDKAVGAKITHIKFASAVLVVYIHCYTSEFQGIPAFYMEQAFEDWLSQGLARVAVPLFFLISGYLMFADTDLSFGRMVRLLPRKIRRLLIPYLVWNALYFFWNIFLGFVFRKPVELTVGVFFRAVFLYSCNAPFWYILQLVIIELLSPILFLLLKEKKSGICLIIAFSIIYFLAENHLTSLMPGLLFFSIGGFLSFHCGGGTWKERLFLPYAWQCLS